MTKAYKIDFTTNTVIVSKAFMNAAETNINSTEFQTYQQFKQMGLTIVPKTVKRTKNTTAHRATYKQMLAYIACVVDASRYLTEFETVRQASRKEANPYQFVCEWFDRTFPNRHDIPELDEEGKIINSADAA